MTWFQLEYIAKGVCLALLALLAFESPDWASSGLFFTAVGCGLLAFLGWAAVSKLREGHRLQGRTLAFVLFLLLENPVLVYAGTLLGMIAGTILSIVFAETVWWHALIALAGGVALGVVFWLLRHVQNRWLRWGAVLAIAAAGAAATVYALEYFEPARQLLFGVHILFAIPLLYLLTLSGRAEETEVEIGAMCVALGLALWMLLPDAARFAGVVVPIFVYFVYTRWVLQSLRVFKHVLRGMSYLNMGEHRDALKAYRRALQFDPRNHLAREGLWRVHKSLDFGKVVHEPETMALVDLKLCLGRARELLLRPGSDAERLEEAHKLLTLIVNQRPEMAAAVDYWRAVAYSHAKDFDKAEAVLRNILDNSAYLADDPWRASVLLPTWQLILVQQPELKRRLGVPMLANEGRRLDAIAAVEAALAESPDDPGASELKRLLYEDLTEEDYRSPNTASAGGKPAGFDYQYCLQLGQSLIGDSARWKRGAEFLRLAALGIPPRGPSIYYQIAQACQKAGDNDGARYNLEMVKVLAREAGVKNLAAEDKQAYFAAVKQLGEAAYGRGEIDKAIENLSLYVESDQSGIDTLRLITELYEKKGDALNALLYNERAMFYDAKDKLLVERKDRYYYSVTPQDLMPHLEHVSKSFDVGYCVRKARSLLDVRGGGADQIDWAFHLLQLARVVQPKNLEAMTLTARAYLRRGEQNEAVALLEEVRAAKPEKFASRDEEESWYMAARLLGDLYLQNLGKPDLALKCFQDYRDHPKSGADTLFKMGQAFEQLGDRVKAARCYQNVTVFSDHPLAPDAHMALQRLEQ